MSTTDTTMRDLLAEAREQIEADLAAKIALHQEHNLPPVHLWGERASNAAREHYLRMTTFRAEHELLARIDAALAMADAIAA